MTERPFDGIVFDFDGVILDSATLKLDAFVDFYADEGPAVRKAVADYQRVNGGVSRFVKFRHFEETLLGRPLGEERLGALVDRFASLVEDRVAAAPAIPGAVEALERHAGHVPVFVVSATPEDELRRIVERRGLARLFTAVRGSPLTKKQIVPGLLAEHGLDPARTLFVGDSTHDSDAAAACGLPFLGIVAPGVENPFPAGTVTIADLRDFEEGARRAMEKGARQPTVLAKTRA